MKQALLSLLRQSFRRRAAPMVAPRVLDQVVLHHVVGGSGSGDTPRTGW